MSLMLANEPPNYRLLFFIKLMTFLEQRNAVVRVTCRKKLPVITYNHLEHFQRVVFTDYQVRWESYLLSGCWINDNDLTVWSSNQEFCSIGSELHAGILDVYPSCVFVFATSVPRIVFIVVAFWFVLFQVVPKNDETFTSRNSKHRLLWMYSNRSDCRFNSVHQCLTLLVFLLNCLKDAGLKLHNHCAVICNNKVRASKWTFLFMWAHLDASVGEGNAFNFWKQLVFEPCFSFERIIVKSNVSIAITNN